MFSWRHPWLLFFCQLRCYGTELPKKTRSLCFNQKIAMEFTRFILRGKQRNLLVNFTLVTWTVVCRKTCIWFPWYMRTCCPPSFAGPGEQTGLSRRWQFKGELRRSQSSWWWLWHCFYPLANRQEHYGAGHHRGHWGGGISPTEVPQELSVQKHSPRWTVLKLFWAMVVGGVFLAKVWRLLAWILHLLLFFF